MAETVLIVDDEDSVRRTFADWLRESGLGCDVIEAADSEQALLLAGEHCIDLAVLDWNLGSGSDGLQLLQDLGQFQPDIVAILVTGFAHQATPLDALRMGVRDYLDKNQNLTREVFLNAVLRQLEKIRPAKTQREFMERLRRFRETVEKVLPLVQATAALNDPLPLPEAVRGLFRFVVRMIRASDGILFVRYSGAGDLTEERIFNAEGQMVSVATVPFARSLAASVVSMQEPVVINDLASGLDAVDLQPFEQGRSNVLAAPVPIGGDNLAVVELFDKDGIGFTNDDKRLLATAAEFGTELLRQALAQRHTHELLFDAVDAALKASDQAGAGFPPSADEDLRPPDQMILDRIREGLDSQRDTPVDAEATLRLAEAIRCLAVRHGPSAVRHCVDLIENVRRLLDEVAGPWEG